MAFIGRSHAIDVNPCVNGTTSEMQPDERPPGRRGRRFEAIGGKIELFAGHALGSICHSDQPSEDFNERKEQLYFLRCGVSPHSESGQTPLLPIAFDISNVLRNNVPILGDFGRIFFPRFPIRSWQKTHLTTSCRSGNFCACAGEICVARNWLIRAAWSFPAVGC